MRLATYRCAHLPLLHLRSKSAHPFCARTKAARTATNIYKSSFYEITMKKFILLVVAALLCVATTIDAVAQRRDKATDTNLVGHVIDARTREHIAYATIAVRGTTLGMATNEGGHYMLIDVPSGIELTVVASTVG